MNPTKLTLGLLGPVIAAASAWLSAAVAKYGVHASKAGIATAIGAGVVAGVSLVLKLIHDVETTGKPNLASDAKAAQDAAAKTDPALATELGWPASPSVLANPPVAPSPAAAPASAPAPGTAAGAEGWQPGSNAA